MDGGSNPLMRSMLPPDIQSFSHPLLFSLSRLNKAFFSGLVHAVSIRGEA